MHLKSGKSCQNSYFNFSVSNCFFIVKNGIVQLCISQETSVHIHMWTSYVDAIFFSLSVPKNFLHETLLNKNALTEIYCLDFSAL